jgi:hypothetical protein
MLFTTERTKDTKNKLKEKFFLPFVLFVCSFENWVGVAVLDFVIPACF